MSQILPPSVLVAEEGTKTSTERHTKSSGNHCRLSTGALLGAPKTKTMQKYLLVLKYFDLLLYYVLQY